MKFLILFAAIVGFSVAQFQPNAFGNNAFQQKYRPNPPPPPQQNYNNYRTSNEANAQTLRFINEQEPDGSFQYSFETDNGIAAQEVGVPKNFGGNPPNVPVVAQGSYSWTSPEGQVVSISYVADEYGYRAVGDAIPTSPPIPDAILRSIEFNKRNGN